MTRANMYKQLQQLGMSNQEIEEELELMELAGELEEEDGQEGDS